jgi:hypothetical protein
MSLTDIKQIFDLFIQSLPSYGSSLNPYNPTRPFYEEFSKKYVEHFTIRTNYMLNVINEIHGRVFSEPMYYFPPTDRSTTATTEEQEAEIKAEVTRVVREYNELKSRK